MTAYEVVNLTRAQAQQIAELLAGGSVLWDRGHTHPCGEVEIRPMRGAADDEP